MNWQIYQYFYEQIQLAVSKMPASKQIHNSNIKINAILHNNPPRLPQPAATHTLLSYKFKPLSDSRSLDSSNPNVRLSHQHTSNPFRGITSIKRRISTAGASKRFPKDFFRPDSVNHKLKKQTALTLKWGGQHKENNQPRIETRKKQYSLNIELQLNESGTLNTPKFHEPLNETENQFLMHRPLPIISPFPEIRQLKVEGTEENYKKFKPNFIKRVKKGELLKLKLESNRSISQSSELGIDLPRLCSTHSQS